MVMIPDDDSTENPAGDEPFPRVHDTLCSGKFVRLEWVLETC
jgi:hypothetical protein